MPEPQHIRRGAGAIRSAVPVLLTGALLVCSAPLSAQQKDRSPVFKSAKPKEDLPKVYPSDPLNQIWQTFQLSRQAAAGDMVAQYEVGVRYFLGVGVEADTVQAAFWTKKSADQNYNPARFNMAILTYHGWGVAWNPFESFRHVQTCAEKGMPDAEYFLSFLYLEDLVVPADYDKALSLLRKAAEAGYEPAKRFLPRVEEIRRQAAPGGQASSSPADSSAGRTAARAGRSIPLHQTFAPVALDFEGDSTGQQGRGNLLRSALESAGPEMRQALGLSRMLESKIQPDSSTLAAITEAADEGSPEALALLGRTYEQGIDVPRDDIRAAFYYVRAIRMDSPRAGLLLQELIRHNGFFGELKTRASRRDAVALYVWAGLVAIGFDAPMAQGGAVITPGQALGFLEDASALGNTQAMIELGLCYYSGRWVGRDLGKAVSLWHDAAQGGSGEAGVRLCVAKVREGGTELGDAVATLEQAASKGSVLAEVALGYCYETGRGVAENMPTAVRLYRTGASRGSQDAYRALRRLHDDLRPSDREFSMPE
jgi:TPR repeat protein